MSGSANIVEIPALGRPFQLGMLYNAKTDKLIQGQELWDKDTIQNAQKETPYIDANFSVITNDSLSTKSEHLGATGNIKMNLLAGLINVSGASNFYNDYKSTRQVIRVSMHSKFIAQKQEVDIQQLGSVKDPAIINATRATHVVSGILFGIEAFLVIDRPYSVQEESQISDIQDKAIANTRLLAGMYESGKIDITAEIDQKEASVYRFKVYCDFPLPSGTSLSNLEEIKAFLIDQLFPLAKQGSKCASLIPKKVWLCPLTELDSSASSVAQPISDGIVSQFEEVADNLVQAEIWVQDLKKNTTLACPSFQQQVVRFLQLLKNFQSDLKEQLSKMIPKIQNSEDELLSLLKQIADSPFSSTNLTALLKGIEQETRMVTLCLKSLSSVKLVSPDELESLCFEYDHVLSFEFKLGGSHKACLDQMDEYLKTKKSASNSGTKINPWYQDGAKKRAIQLKAKTFKEFAQTNNQKEDVTFVVSVSSDTPTCKEEGAAIVLYDDESPVEFNLPSKPLTVKVSLSAKNEVTLTWSKPKQGADTILSYRVGHRPTKDSAADWIFTNTSGVIETQAVTQLNPDCEYEFGVQAECKIGLSASSEVVTFKIPFAQEEQETLPKSALLESIPKLESARSFTSLPTSDLESSSHVFNSPEEQASASNFSMSSSQLMSPPFMPLGGPFTPGSQYEGAHPSSMEYPPTELTRENQLRFMESQFRAQMGYPQYPYYGTETPTSGYLTPSKPASARLVPSTGTETPQSERDEWRIPTLMVPLVQGITHKSVELKWIPPDTAVEAYTVFYHKDKDPDNLRKTEINGEESSCCISGLTHNTQYVFKLQAKLSNGTSIESEETRIIDIPAHLPLLIKSKSKVLKQEKDKEPTNYELSKRQTMKNFEKKVAKFEVGQSTQQEQTRVLMVVGATGAGKTTLINGIANYMYGVQWDDDFRFVLVPNEPQKSQAHSQTKWITAYTLHRADGSPIPYSLTIIDTPGFGDTEGIERDKQIVSQIKDFFSIKPPNGIDVLHGIGFVAQSSLARLSTSQKYIFDSILSIYGKDVASNIFVMTTFADGQLPPVLEAIKVAKIPHQTYFKFNNSALFVRGDEDSFDAMFWKMGIKSFTHFFVDFGKAKLQSLQLTREVLDEREQLENVLKELQPQIHAGLTKMDELQKVVSVLQRNKALIEQNKDFAFAVPVTKQRRIPTPRGHYTTNCLNCTYTCHDNCIYSNDADKQKCCAMDGNGYCKICPDRCVWSKHVNNPYILELYQEDETRTSAELKERYDTAKEGESSAETMISNIKGELEYLEFKTLEMVDKARKSLMRLDEIALKPNPLSEVDYIDKLIASEEMQRKPGFFERIKAYKQLRKKAKLLRQIQTHNPNNDSSAGIFSFFGDGSTDSYDPITIEILKKKKSKKPGLFEVGVTWIKEGIKSVTK